MKLPWILVTLNLPLGINLIINKMKNSLKISLLFLALSATSCIKNEKTILDSIDISVNGKDLDQLTNAQDLVAWIDEENIISGFGGDYFFQTSDYFESTWIQSGKLEGKVLFKDYSNIITREGGNFNDLLIKKSNDYGQNYNVILSIPSIVIGQRNGNLVEVGNHDFGTVHFISPNRGYFFSYFHSNYPGSNEDGIKIYRILNGEANFRAYLSDLYTGKDIYFRDKNNGFLLTHDNVQGYTNNSYVFTTSDGGYNWDGPFKNLNNIEFNRVLALSDTRVLAYGDQEQSSTNSTLSISDDGGMNWQKVDCNCGDIVDLQFVDEQFGFLVSKSLADGVGQTHSLYKSIDGGASWLKTGTHNIYGDHLAFINEKVGIATSGRTVELTENGGNSWELLVFPHQ